MSQETNPQATKQSEAEKRHKEYQKKAEKLKQEHGVEWIVPVELEYEKAGRMVAYLKPLGAFDELKLAECFTDENNPKVAEAAQLYCLAAWADGDEKLLESGIPMLHLFTKAMEEGLIQMEEPTSVWVKKK